MAKRAKIFDNETPLDTADFRPKLDASTEARPDAADIDQVAGRKFRSREVNYASTVDQPATIRQPSTVGFPSTRRLPMTYRTGRNVTFSVKTTPATVDEFYALAQQQGWKAGETFEKAVELLKKAIERDET